MGGEGVGGVVCWLEGVGSGSDGRYGGRVAMIVCSLLWKGGGEVVCGRYSWVAWVYHSAAVRCGLWRWGVDSGSDGRYGGRVAMMVCSLLWREVVCGRYSWVAWVYHSAAVRCGLWRWGVGSGSDGRYGGRVAMIVCSLLWKGGGEVVCWLEGVGSGSDGRYGGRVAMMVCSLLWREVVCGRYSWVARVYHSAAVRCGLWMCGVGRRVNGSLRSWFSVLDGKGADGRCRVGQRYEWSCVRVGRCRFGGSTALCGSVICDPCSGEMNGNPLARVHHSAAFAASPGARSDGSGCDI